MAEQRRDPNKGMRFARVACVVTVGARPPVYEQKEIQHNKTGEMVMANMDQPSDPGSEGIPYAFRQYQRVPANHPAVKESPGSFISIDEMDDAELELVTFVTVYAFTPREQGIRMADALAVAILYMMADPPRRSLARQALKAAMAPAQPRWADQ